MLSRLVRVLFGNDPAPQISTEQRRRSVRLRCRLPVKCVLGATTARATVIDVGDGGLRLEIDRWPRRMQPGTLFDVNFMGAVSNPTAARTITVRLMWARRVGEIHHLGVMYLDAIAVLTRSWVAFTLRRIAPSLRLSDDRRHMRCHTDLRACLRLHPASKIEHWRGRVVDLSVRGALLADLALPVGTHGTLIIHNGHDSPHGAWPGGEGEIALRGRIVRHSGTAACMHFDYQETERLEGFMQYLLSRSSGARRQA